jgi:hypothetical protein
MPVRAKHDRSKSLVGTHNCICGQDHAPTDIFPNRDAPGKDAANTVAIYHTFSPLRN